MEKITEKMRKNNFYNELNFKNVIIWRQKITFLL